MATVEYITKRIEGKEKEVDKLTKKLERIQKAQATGWEVNPYYYNEYDLKYTKRDLEAAQEALKKYQEDLVKATEKANSRNVTAILEFLEGWKKRMREYYTNMIPRYLKARAEYYEQKRIYGEYYRFREERAAKEKEYRKIRKEFRETWGFMEEYIPYGDKFDWERFEKNIKKEAERKYDNIIERTNEIVGTITDATGLRVGYKGELDGFILGERGKAKVQTIGAGGYNIQCFHFRILVHEVK